MPVASGSLGAAVAVFRVRQHAKVSVNRIGRWFARSVRADSTARSRWRRLQELDLAARLRLPQPEPSCPSGLLKRPVAGQRAACQSGSRSCPLQSDLACIFIPRCGPQSRKNRLGTFLLVMRSSSEKKAALRRSYAKYEASVRGAAEGALNSPAGAPRRSRRESTGRPCTRWCARAKIAPKIDCARERH